MNMGLYAYSLGAIALVTAAVASSAGRSIPQPAQRADLAVRASRVLDVGDMTIVPGLIDAHVHLAIGGSVRANALADLRAGFTTVADPGALRFRWLCCARSWTHRAHAAGLTIVFGTDGGVLPHGRGVDEMEALVAAGLSPLEVVQAATIDAPRALAIGDSVGRLDVGMSADFVAVRGDPLRDVAALRSVGLVVSRGRIAVGPPR